MTTAQQILNRAAEIIGYKDPDEALSGSDASNFLGVLNDLLGSWNTDRLYIPASQTVSASVSASPVSIGTVQTINTDRPIRIEGAWVRVNGVDYELEPLTTSEYDAIADKAATGSQPTCFYYSAGVPSGSIYLWPVPSAAVTLVVRVMVQLTEFADLSTSYSLASGYKRALEYSLAEELAPGRRPLDPQVMRLAMNARKKIRVANYEPVLMSPFAHSVMFNIQTGE